MGTRGYKVHRHKGWYFAQYNHYDSYPEGLGIEVLAEIPTDPEKFLKWLEGMRHYFDELLEEHQDALNKNGGLREDDGLEITRKQPTNDLFIEWVYEIDLDHLVFHIDCAPMYRLDHMPPTDLFLEGISFNVYGNRACGRDVPAEYRFTLDSLPPPPVENSAQEKYHNSVQENAPCTVNALLSLNTAPALADVIIQERTAYFHICMHAWNEEATELAFLSDAQTMSSKQRSLAFNLAALALLPASYMLWELAIAPEEVKGDGEANTVERKVSFVSLAEERVWWPRRHICVLIATYLAHEDNRKAAIAQVVEEITKDGREVPDIVYGVVFSVFHCVLVRVDKRDNGRFTHTDVLSSCPDLFTSGDPSTEQTPAGLEAMIRLGNLPANDDIDFFYDSLRSSWASENHKQQKPASDSESINGQPDTSQPAAPSGARHGLPQEMLNHIAESITDPRALSAFAFASRSTMAAALPLLRLPRIFLPTFETGLVLQRSIPLPVAPKKRSTKSTKAAFDARYEDQPAVVIVSSSFASGAGLEQVAQGRLFMFRPPAHVGVCFTVFRETVKCDA